MEKGLLILIFNKSTASVIDERNILKWTKSWYCWKMKGLSGRWNFIYVRSFSEGKSQKSQ